jgi:hypothetical protein
MQAARAKTSGPCSPSAPIASRQISGRALDAALAAVLEARRRLDGGRRAFATPDR